MLRFLLCLLLYLIGCAPELAVPAQPNTLTPRSAIFDLSGLSGRWEGGIKGSTLTYTIRVLINPRAVVGEVAAVVDYPSIGCAGNWRLRGKNASSYIFQESIVQGLSTCAAEGVVELVYDPAQDALEYSWRDPRGGSGEKGVLKRVK